MTKHELKNKIINFAKDCDQDSDMEHFEAYLESWLQDFAERERNKVFDEIPNVLRSISKEKEHANRNTDNQRTER